MAQDPPQDLETYMKGYQKCSRPWECFVRDSRIRHSDFDGLPMSLYDGTYKMGPLTSNCLIQKFQGQGQAELKYYTLMKSFRHPNIVSVQNCYEESGNLRFVLSWVDGSLSGWLRTEGAGTMFRTTMKGSAPRGSLKQMIFDLCRGLEHLLDENLYPAKIDKKDIFVYKSGHKGVATLLVNKVEKLKDSCLRASRKTKLWEEMRKALYDICKGAVNSFDPLADKFMLSIGVKNLRKLQNYPDSWDYKKKASYLLSIMSEDIPVILLKIQGVGIKWPRTPKGRVRSPFYEMLEHEAKTPGGRTYNQQDPLDYVRLCKNMVKHWRFVPDSVKAECDSVEQLIRKMEKWTPEIWCILYDAIA